MSSIENIKLHKRATIDRYTKADNIKALTQVVTTLLPLTALWYLVVLSAELSYWLTAGVTLLMSLFLLRVFVLLHECGHGSLFRSVKLNSAFGFVFGVIAGMPQYVWSQHHAFHHATNGNWAKYRGAIATASVEEFAAMTSTQQRGYLRARQLWLAPFGGFVYLVFNPRFTWLKGCLGLLSHVVRRKFAQPSVSIATHAAEFKTRYWANRQEFWHMTWNNLVLLSVWALMSNYLGVGLFFAVYVVSVSLAGGAGIILFTVQHNFEHAYASSDVDWDYDVAAMQGTSFLVLPAWLNWFSANIAYHHVHHLSAKIPNYFLATCHEENKHLFVDVTRVKLSKIPHALKCLLWDERARRIISVDEYRQQTGSGP